MPGPLLLHSSRCRTMKRNVLRIQNKAGPITILVDGQNVMAEMRRLWPNASREDPLGVLFQDIVVKQEALLATMPTDDAADTWMGEVPIFACKGCGDPRDVGVNPVRVELAGPEVRWKLTCAFHEAGKPLEYVFDAEQ